MHIDTRLKKACTRVFCGDLRKVLNEYSDWEFHLPFSTALVNSSGGKCKIIYVSQRSKMRRNTVYKIFKRRKRNDQD